MGNEKSTLMTTKKPATRKTAPKKKKASVTKASTKKVATRKKAPVKKTAAPAAATASAPLPKKRGPKPGTRRVRRRKLTGGSSGYYKVKITKPTTAKKAYTAECNDIIEALNLTWPEANIFKAIWRQAAGRLGFGKPGQESGYDVEKMDFFMERIKANK